MRSLLVLIALAFVAACTPGEGIPGPITESQPTSMPSPTHTITAEPTIQIAASTNPGYASGEFPLVKGTTWVYSYDEYEPDPASPAGITTATYEFTDTVVETRSEPPFLVARVRHEEHLLKADADWPVTEPRRAAESWYAVSGQQVYESPQPVDLTSMLLAFDFPLAPGKSWCPNSSIKGQKITDCKFAGEISVSSEQSYSTRAGAFAHCFQLTQNFNSGPIIQWFCNGVGIVAEKYDHAGTRFGFQDTLVSYVKGSP